DRGSWSLMIATWRDYGRWSAIVRAANALAALATLAFAIALLFDPTLGLPSEVTAGTGARIYAEVSSVRSIVLAGAVLYALTARPGRVLPVLLVVSGLIQVGDAILNAVHHNTPTIFGAAILAAIPLGTVWWLLSIHTESITRSATSRRQPG